MVKQSTSQVLNRGLKGVHHKDSGDSCSEPIDTEKNKKELSWAVDLNMLASTIFDGKCSDFVRTLNQSNALEKEYAGIVQMARDAYLSPDRPVYYDVDLNSMPSLSQDMQTARNNALTAAFDIYAKAVVSGSSYPADQAMKDAKAAWDRAGGKELDQFYADWYVQNKDKVVLTKDYLKMLVK
jgi:putative aldouronate transport system substrate-binding protein